MQSLSAQIKSQTTEIDEKIRRILITKQVLKNSKIVCLDVDSTVCKDEGLDELARYCGVYKEIQRFTNMAMSGNMLFEKSFEARLNIIKPSHDTLKQFVKKNPPRLTNGVKKFVNTLHKMGKSVYLVSGGIDAIIKPVAEELGIESGNVYANKLFFDVNTGKYINFDRNKYTSKTGGKKKVIFEIMKNTDINHGIVMIGDGITDLEAKPPATVVIGFGANKCREIVQKNCDWFVKDFDTLTKCLE